MTQVEYKNKLIKKYHILIGKVGMSDEDKQTLLAQWNVTTSKDMSIDQLLQLCNLLEKFTSPEESELAKWQKWARDMVKSYGKSLGMTYTDAYAEAIICRSTGKKSFGSISKNRLVGIYNQFKKAKSDKSTIQNIIIEDAQATASLN